MRRLFALALVVDHMNRRNNYEERIERIEGNISRWESSLSRLQDAIDRTRSRIESNESRYEKSLNFRDRLSSPSTLDWLSRQEHKAINHRLDEVRREASNKIADHEAKVRDVEQQLERIRGWISDDERKLKDMRYKRSELECKISSARSSI